MTVSEELETVIRRMANGGMKPSAIRKWTLVSERTQARIVAVDPEKKRLVGRRAPRESVAKRRKLVTKLLQEREDRNGTSALKFPSTPALKAECARRGVVVKKEALRRDLHKSGLKSLVRGKRPSLPYKERTSFCEKWLKNNKSKEEASRICFSDEHEMTVNNHGSRLQWVKCRADLEERVSADKRNIPRFQLWAAIGYNWRSEIVILPKVDAETGQGARMNAKRYIDLVLTEDFAKSMKTHNFVYMQDGARAHTAKQTKAHLAKLKVKTLVFWPPRSPDLNPIENVWSHLNGLVSLQCPRTEEELIKATKECWKQIPVAVMNKFVVSFLGKCGRAVAKEKGKEVAVVKKPLGRPPGSKNKPKPKKMVKAKA